MQCLRLLRRAQQNRHADGRAGCCAQWLSQRLLQSYRFSARQEAVQTVQYENTVPSVSSQSHEVRGNRVVQKRRRLAA